MNEFNCEYCYHSHHDDEPDSVSACACCEDGSLFTPTATSRTIVCPFCGSADIDSYYESVYSDKYGEVELKKFFVCGDCDKKFNVCFKQTHYEVEGT